MRFGSTTDDRVNRKINRATKARDKYKAKPTKMIWFAWYPVHFEDGNWGFCERVRCTRRIEHRYDHKWKVRRWKYNPINIVNDKDLANHLSKSRSEYKGI